MRNGKPMRPNYLSDLFGKHVRKHKLKKIAFHDLRHPYVKHTTKNIILKSRKPKLSENRPDNLGYLLL